MTTTTQKAITLTLTLDEADTLLIALRDLCFRREAPTKTKNEARNIADDVRLAMFDMAE